MDGQYIFFFFSMSKRYDILITKRYSLSYRFSDNKLHKARGRNPSKAY
ncbi:MAG: hypothetical protein HY999_02895 [Nitrospinae bacterium]|nr:hypothetical protein [Nitrospinota bacterium]